MKKAYLKNKAMVPSWWSKLNESGRRQRRTEDVDESSLNSTREFLHAESKMIKWCAERSDDALAAAEGKKKSEKIPEEQEWELEKQWLTLETKTLNRHESLMAEADFKDFRSLKSVVYRDLYYHRPKDPAYETIDEDAEDGFFAKQKNLFGLDERDEGDEDEYGADEDEGGWVGGGGGMGTGGWEHGLGAGAMDVDL